MPSHEMALWSLAVSSILAGLAAQRLRRERATVPVGSRRASLLMLRGLLALCTVASILSFLLLASQPVPRGGAGAGGVAGAAEGAGDGDGGGGDGGG